MLLAALAQTPSPAAESPCPRGWSELPVRGQRFEAVVRWNRRAENSPPTGMAVPDIAGMLLAVLVSAGPDPDVLPPLEEFAAYRRVLKEMQTGLDELEQCYT